MSAERPYCEGSGQLAYPDGRKGRGRRLCPVCFVERNVIHTGRFHQHRHPRVPVAPPPVLDPANMPTILQEILERLARIEVSIDLYLTRR